MTNVKALEAVPLTLTVGQIEKYHKDLGRPRIGLIASPRAKALAFSAPKDNDDEIPIVDANDRFNRKVEFTEPAPAGDPATEAFYRDRLAAARRCTNRVPNPKDADDQRAMSRKIDLVELREYQFRRMADVERDAGFSWFEEDEYKRITGYTERKRK